MMSASPGLWVPCAICSGQFRKFSSLQKICGDPVCRAELKRQHERKAAAKRARAEKKAGRERLKTLSELCRETQKAVNAYVRFRDRYRGCISCDSSRVDDAGHRFPIGSKFRLNKFRFDVEAIHGQCRSCNSYRGGNPDGYDAGLIKRFGRAFPEMLKAAKARAEQSVIKLTRDEVMAIRINYRRRLRKAKKAEGV